MYHQDWQIYQPTYSISAHTRYVRSTSDLNTSTFPNHTSNEALGNVCTVRNIDTSAESIAFCTFLAMVLVASVIGNSLVIAAIWLSKQLRNRVTVYFIVSLACSDMLNAISQTPFNISFKLHRSFCHTLGSCYVWLIGDAIATPATILSLFLIAVDRYVAIRFPFSHRSVFSARSVRKIIVGLWCFVVLWAISGLFHWDKDKIRESGSVLSISADTSQCANRNKYFYVVGFLGIYIVPLIIMTFTYFMILQIAIMQIRAIELTQIDVSSNLETGPSSSQTNEAIVKKNNTAANRKKREKRLKKELKATKSVAMVYLAFVICYLPSCIINIIILFVPKHFVILNKNDKTLFLFIFYFFVQVLPRTNTMINPIIYSFSNKQFRKGFRSLYNRIMGNFDSFENSSSDDNVTRLRGVGLATTVGSPSSSINSPAQSPQHMKTHQQLQQQESGNHNPSFQNSL